MKSSTTMLLTGLVTCICSLPASAGWLDAVTKAVDTISGTTNAVEFVKSTGGDGKITSATPEVKTAAKNEKSATTEEKKSVVEEKAKSDETAKTEKSSRLALSEEEADDIANGQPISIDMDDLAARMKASSDYVLIDVRKPKEFKSGHIKGAKNVPFDDVSNSMSKPCSDKDMPVYLYCLSGDRAIAAGQYLIKNGYKRVYNCGGIDDWSGKLVK